ncbi:hypothetical protein LV178_04475, partial [Burkholderia mallei]|nr:hypothetical protein [Burkholderia mallei]
MGSERANGWSRRAAPGWTNAARAISQGRRDGSLYRNIQEQSTPPLPVGRSDDARRLRPSQARTETARAGGASGRAMRGDTRIAAVRT